MKREKIGEGASLVPDWALGRDPFEELERPEPEPRSARDELAPAGVPAHDAQEGTEADDRRPLGG